MLHDVSVGMFAEMMWFAMQNIIQISLFLLGKAIIRLYLLVRYNMLLTVWLLILYILGGNNVFCAVLLHAVPLLHIIVVLMSSDITDVAGRRRNMLPLSCLNCVQYYGWYLGTWLVTSWLVTSWLSSTTETDTCCFVLYVTACSCVLVGTNFLEYHLHRSFHEPPLPLQQFTFGWTHVVTSWYRSCHLKYCPPKGNNRNCTRKQQEQHSGHAPIALRIFNMHPGELALRYICFLVPWILVSVILVPFVASLLNLSFDPRLVLNAVFFWITFCRYDAERRKMNYYQTDDGDAPYDNNYAPSYYLSF
jgi:hypothetical protein